MRGAGSSARLRMSRVSGFAARLLMLCLLLGAAGSAVGQEAPRLVPLPRSMTMLPGRLHVSAPTPGGAAPAAARAAALRFIALLRRTAGVAPRLRPAAASAA